MILNVQPINVHSFVSLKGYLAIHSYHIATIEPATTNEQQKRTMQSESYGPPSPVKRCGVRVCLQPYFIRSAATKGALTTCISCRNRC